MWHEFRTNVYTSLQQQNWGESRVAVWPKKRERKTPYVPYLKETDEEGKENKKNERGHEERSRALEHELRRKRGGAPGIHGVEQWTQR